MGDRVALVLGVASGLTASASIIFSMMGRMRVAFWMIVASIGILVLSVLAAYFLGLEVTNVR